MFNGKYLFLPELWIPACGATSSSPVLCFSFHIKEIKHHELRIRRKKDGLRRKFWSNLTAGTRRRRRALRKLGRLPPPLPPLLLSPL